LVERQQVRLRLALPWLTGSLGSEEPRGDGPLRVPAAEWLVARGRVLPPQVSDWRAWLLAGVGTGADLLRRFPAGPCVRAAGTGARPKGTWACARAVHLLTAVDHLQLAPALVTLDEAETAELLGEINRHFDGRGFEFHRSGKGDWSLECTSPIECTSVEPAAAAGRNLRDLMPGGRDGARVRALLNEIQMLLHEHPVNSSRIQRGLPAVNSLWLWGFGCADEVPVASLPALYTDDAWLAGLWRLQGSTSRAIEDFEAGVSGGEPVSLLGGSHPGDRGAREAVSWADTHCFAPARDALRRGDAREVELLLGDRAVVTGRGARFRFWRRTRPLTEVAA
jgi:hypothetical protein